MENFTPLYYDAEFTGLHRNTTLISIGLVTDKGSTFYAEFTDYDKKQCNEWINDNVIANLLYRDQFSFIKYHDHYSNGIVTDRPKGNYSVEMLWDSDRIRCELLTWLKTIQTITLGNPTFRVMTDCYAYDWMLLVDLLSADPTKSALGMPDFINYIPMDLSTLMASRGIDPDISRESLDDLFVIKVDNTMKKHNSLWDAQVIKKWFKSNRLNTHTIQLPKL